MAFERKGDAPQWELVADYMRSTPDGHVASLAELEAVADSAPGSIPSLVGIVNARLADEGLRLVAVPRRGYRWATPAEIADEATRGRQLRIRRGLTRVVHSATAWRNHPDATDEDRRRADEVSMTAREVARVHRKASAQVRGYRPERPRFARSED